MKRFKKVPIALPATLVAELNQLRQEADTLNYVREWHERFKQNQPGNWAELANILSGSPPRNAKDPREEVIEQVEILAPEFGMEDNDCDRLIARLRELTKGQEREQISRLIAESKRSREPQGLVDEPPKYQMTRQYVIGLSDGTEATVLAKDVEAAKKRAARIAKRRDVSITWMRYVPRAC